MPFLLDRLNKSAVCKHIAVLKLTAQPKKPEYTEAGIGDEGAKPETRDKTNWRSRMAGARPSAEHLLAMLASLLSLYPGEAQRLCQGSPEEQLGCSCNVLQGEEADQGSRNLG